MLYKIAVIFPSRGLSFSQTCEELLDNLDGYEYEIFFAHGLSLPDCFNVPLEKALKKSFTHYWFVEDDMFLPKYTLVKMLEISKPAVAYDYPVTAAGVGAVQRDKKGKALFSGTGCLLVESKLLKSLKRPIFRTDVRWDMHVTPQGLELKRRVDKGETYGMHDVTFGLELYRRGKSIFIMDETIGQRKLKSLGQVGTNNGQHDIDTWTQIHKSPDFIDLASASQESPLIAVKLKSGEVTNVTEETAQRLVKDGKGKRIKANDVGFVE